MAQALITLAASVGYVGSKEPVFPIAAGAAALVIYIAALCANSLFHRPTSSAYILVFGGTVAVVAQTIALAVNGSPFDAAHASLLFIALILESGLLFAPEAALIMAFVTTAISAFAILFALSLDSSVSNNEAYLLVVYTLGLQALSGLLAWLFSIYIGDSVVEGQKSRELQFSHVRLESLASAVEEQQRQLDQTVGGLQLTIAHALTGEPMARAEVNNMQLAPLADSLNLLLQRLEEASRAEQARLRVDAAALPMLEALMGMTDGTPTPTSLPIMTNTTLDSVAVYLTQLQASLTQRLGRIQRTVSEVVRALTHARAPLDETVDAVKEAQQIDGALIALSDKVLASADQEVALLHQAQRILSGLLPESLTSGAPALREMPATDASGNEDFRGLGRDLNLATPGYTGTFPVLGSEEADANGDGIVPMTVPLPAVQSEGAPEASAAVPSALTQQESAPPAGEAGAVPPELIEAWTLLEQAEREATSLDRQFNQFVRDLGVQAKKLSSVDVNLAWFRGALEAVRGNVEQLQQIAGTNMPLPGMPEVGQAASSRPLAQENMPGGMPSRPIQPLADVTPFPSSGEVAKSTAEDNLPALGSMNASDLLSDFTDIGDSETPGAQ
jgi:hypothetical protein